MAKKVFKVQLKNSFIFNISYMYFIVTALFIISLELVLFYQFPKYIPIIVLAGLPVVKFILLPAKDELDVGGHEQVVIDDAARTITIDNEKPVSLDKISYIYLKLYKPSYISATMVDSFISLIAINSEIIIGYKNGEHKAINIQRKSALYGLVKELQKHKEIVLKFDENYNGGLLNRFPWFLFLLFIALLVVLFRH